MGLMDKVKKGISNVFSDKDYYAMDTKEAREAQVRDDYEYAKMQRADQDKKWIEMDNYYHNKHVSSYIAQKMQAAGETSYELPTLTDAYVQVESQIDTVIPSFQFKGRDSDTDPTKAKGREDAVKYIAYNNKLERLNIENERTLNKLGNAFWKAVWNPDVKGAGYVGDIEIGNPQPNNVFPDPAAYTLEECEFLDHVYRMHKRKARRVFGDIISKVNASSSHSETEIFEDRNHAYDDDTVQIIEHWYRDDEGDIACSICVEGVEVKHIPKFWEKTRHSGNQMYPFVKYCKIPKDQSFWDMSEIEVIQQLLDAADMEFMTALLNDHFMANDIIIYEQGALADGYEIQHIPGEEIPLSKNNINNIRRLGGVSNNANLLEMMNFIKDRIEETCGNASSAQGIEPARVTTARGIQSLNERSDQRKNIKKADRLKGFEELYKLLDWMALEFYDDNRMFIIRGNTKEIADRMVTYNSDTFAITQNGTAYFPTVDVEITAGDGIQKSKSFTMETISELIKTPINIQNVGLVNQLIDILELPQGDELKKAIEDGLMAAMMPPPLTAMGINSGVNPQAGMGSMPGQPGQQPGMGNMMGNNPQNNPQVGDSGNYVLQVKQIMDSMTPEEYQIFMSKSPDEKLLLIRTLIQGGMPNAQAIPSGQQAPTNPNGQTAKA